MRRLVMAALVVALALVSTRLFAAEKAVLSAETKPADLVTAALKTELDGPTSLRAELLAEAIRHDPDFAPARWQSGFVRIDNQWVKLDEVPRHARGDEQLAAYRKRRAGLIDTADNHRQLARWCNKNGLPEEERVHWAKVLEFEPMDPEAIERMGLKLVGGRLLSRGQIENERELAAEARRSVREWRPKFVAWRKALEHGSSKQLDDALRGLRQFKDPAALAALESVFGANPKSQKSDDLNRLVIETAGRIRDPMATKVLLRRAITVDSADVRAAACDELKKRPIHAYVPQLVAAIPSKLGTRFHVFVLPGGAVMHEHEIFIEGQAADLAMTYQSSVQPTDAAAAWLVTPGTATREMLAAQEIEVQAESARRQTEWLRDRIQFVLERTTGFKEMDDPRLWERAYNDYYGLPTVEAAKPLYTQQAFNYQTYFSLPPTPTRNDAPTSGGKYNQPAIPPQAQPTRLPWYTSDPYMGGTVLPPPLSHGYCFAAGTLIQTMQGLTAVEKIEQGDRVLSQDPRTGELVFKPVQARTLRPPTRLVKIGIGSDSIVATPGHPFWLIGSGWQTAKRLKTGDRLHTASGAVAIDTIEPTSNAEVYNLVVSEFHNYFVGRSALLAHDNSPLEETSTLVPGLPLDAVTRPLLDRLSAEAQQSVR
jgi:hypothetical protein